MARNSLISRTALAFALSMGAATLATPGIAVAKEKAQAPKVAFSKEFTAAAAELDKTVSAASSNPAVTAASEKARAAKDPAAKQAAAAEVDAALGGAKAKLAAAEAVATTPGDKLKTGELTRNLGVLTADPAMQKKGLVMMLESGALQPGSTGQIQYLAGVTAYQSGDYAGAAQYLKQAKDGGYVDPQNMLDAVLADSYKRSGNTAGALAATQQALASARAAGTKPPETSIRTALQAAYDAKQVGPATDLAVELAKYYPSPESWNASISIVRAMTSLNDQDNLDLMRLMSRTGAMTTRNDYLEYVQNADPRRLPGETLKIISQGTASGKLSASDLADARATANGRLGPDKASLPGLEADARKSSASATTLTGAGDAFLSYDQPAKAEEFYKNALAKGPADRNRVALRLGIAQADQGKYAEAQSSFAQVTGASAPVAKLWSGYAASKAGGGTTATAAATTAPATPAAR